ncbi:hypothetical protein GGX14DRAFT_608891 [Mycena pura]|uniref:Uncharacterized protein n=1 Tax=Mycena pura TaxID=153505 RepID=A0AAD6UKH4_9AGAR|nr:hypothetical protein GGX14DRAFT_608891 [Mycena pura]
MNGMSAHSTSSPASSRGRIAGSRFRAGFAVLQRCGSASGPALDDIRLRRCANEPPSGITQKEKEHSGRSDNGCPRKPVYELLPQPQEDFGRDIGDDYGAQHHWEEKEENNENHNGTDLEAFKGIRHRCGSGTRHARGGASPAANASAALLFLIRGLEVLFVAICFAWWKGVSRSLAGHFAPPAQSTAVFDDETAREDSEVSLTIESKKAWPQTACSPSVPTGRTSCASTTPSHTTNRRPASMEAQRILMGETQASAMTYGLGLAMEDGMYTMLAHNGRGGARLDVLPARPLAVQQAPTPAQPRSQSPSAEQAPHDESHEGRKHHEINWKAGLEKRLKGAASIQCARGAQQPCPAAARATASERLSAPAAPSEPERRELPVPAAVRCRAAADVRGGCGCKTYDLFNGMQTTFVETETV